MSEQRQGLPIEVGVDVSGLNVTALRWAVQQAGLTGADVHAITGWGGPVHDDAPDPGSPLTAAAEDAQRLATGSHGRGELPGMHLGRWPPTGIHHAPSSGRGRPAGTTPAADAPPTMLAVVVE
jgi:hypothetical protein